MYGWKMVMQRVMTPHKEVCKDMQKNTEQSGVVTFFTKSSVSPFAMRLLITLTTSGQEHRRHSSKTNIFSCLGIVNLHIIVLHESLVPLTSLFPYIFFILFLKDKFVQHVSLHISVPVDNYWRLPVFV